MSSTFVVAPLVVNIGFADPDTAALIGHGSYSRGKFDPAPSRVSRSTAPLYYSTIGEPNYEFQTRHVGVPYKRGGYPGISR